MPFGPGIGDINHTSTPLYIGSSDEDIPDTKGIVNPPSKLLQREPEESFRSSHHVRPCYSALR
jgi:hypothetical protein